MSDQAIEQSVEERMVSLLDEPEQVEEIESDEPEEQASAEEGTEEEEASDEDTPEPRTFKLKRGEEEVEAPESEVIELAQKGYDYTKKTQALAEERKTVEDRTQALAAQETYFQQQVSIQNALIKDIAKVEALNEQIEQFDKVDWQSLSDQDPVQAQKLFFQYSQLTNKRTQLSQELNQKQGQAQAVQMQKMQQAVAEGYKQLSKDIPDWSAEKAHKIREGAKAYGYTDAELEGIHDPRLVRLMHDATQFRALKQSQPNVNNKLANKPPVVKPSGKDAKVAAKSRYSEERQQLRKSGDQNLAVKLIERML